MCGIAGYVDFSSKSKRSNLRSMTGEIVYRGPDSSGEYFSQNNNVALGIRRLSIIDLITGDQPISNEDGTVTIVYNGEVYNYRELKTELVKDGHKFKSESDTEVLVHLYEKYGEKMPKYLNGMFAFAIWDEEKRKLFLARDRAGIKPLYYFKSGNTLIFGSEVKTILKHALYKKEVDKEGLFLYFYLGFTIGEKTIFKGISRLLPGHTLSFSKSGLKIRRFFELLSKKDMDVQSLDNLLQDSVKMQLHADVPVGVFLSGGLDSSLIAYYVSRVKKLKSFSIGFKEAGFDESKHAHYVAKKLGTEHYSEEFKSSDVINIFEEISSKLDEPLADASLVPTYKVCKLARRQVKVVLSGDGGDELFGGYPTYQAHIYAKYFSLLPRSSYDLLSNFLDFLPDTLVNLIPTSFKDYPKKKLGKIVLAGLKMQNPEKHLYWMRTFFLGDKNLFAKPDLKFLKKMIQLDEVDKPAKLGQIIDFHTYLPDDFLMKTDRAAMYNSLEVRVPYLGNDVIDYACSTKYPHVNFLQTKLQLRKLLEEKLPDVARRPKKGFGIPLEKWLRGKLKDFGYSMLTSEKLYNYLDKKKIMNLWDNHQKSRENNSGTIWMLIVFSAWLDNWS